METGQHNAMHIALIGVRIGDGVPPAAWLRLKKREKASGGRKSLSAKTRRLQQWP